MVSNNLEPVFTTWMTLPKVTATCNSRLHTYFLPFETNTENTCVETLQPLIKFDEVLDVNPAFKNTCCKTLPSIQAGDFGFVCNNIVTKSAKVYYDGGTSKTIFTLRENQRPKIDRTIEQESTDALSTNRIAKNVDSLAKPELKTPEIRQHQPRGLFETLQQPKTVVKTQGCTMGAAKPSVFSKIDRVSFMKLQSFSCDASKRSADCKTDDKSQRLKRKDGTKDNGVCTQEIVRSRSRIEKRLCGKTQRKDTCVSSQDDACGERQQRKSKPCKSYTCPELKRRMPCNWDAERCPEDSRKHDMKRVSPRDRARQSRDSNCLQEQGIDTQYSKNVRNDARNVTLARKSGESAPEKVENEPTAAAKEILPEQVIKTVASCSKDKDRKQGPSCEKRKRKCATKEKDKIMKKCVKGPAKCISRKKAIDKKKTCRSTQKDKRKESCESTKKYNREEFCTNRKKEFMKDEKPKEQSIKQQIDREYKEIDECKKGFKKESKDNKAKMVCTEHKLTDLNRTISSDKKQQRKDNEKLGCVLNELVISTDTIFKWLNGQSRIINSKVPIVAKDVRLFNITFDRLFSTAKLDYQDDFAIERTMSDGKILQNYSANSDDELPSYVEIEHQDEEDEVYD
ncbi:PREDICTED: axoneme-associated protein mst101(2)-like [Vollenhovia emeryi]|uniref:axoneme-associated protein mst101(2)-like n=1 Tax=Vollenhovia emeryi TaxID=411798 RepID=UPI0005F4F44A|nr:PREDICTED: axoneme-associated protein mst101(2)-like [Vollenhovia emeryi]